MNNIQRRRDFLKTIAAGAAGSLVAGSVAGSLTAHAAAPTRRLKIGFTCITWGTFPRPTADITLEAALKDIANLGFWGFETFGETLIDWDSRQALQALIDRYGVPLKSGYCGTNLTDSTKRADSIAQVIEMGKAIKKYGGTFGGPVKKDKTFFFLYYEGLRERAGETREATVPSQNERNGNFGEVCTIDVGGVFDSSGNCINPVTSAFLPNGQIFNEFANQPVPYNQLPFPANTISQNLLPYFPLPNAGENTFVSTLNKSTDNDQFGMRLDHYLSPRDVLNFRYIFSQGNVLDPLSTAGANVPGFPVGEDHRSQNFVATETHTFSPSVVGLARVSFLRNRFLFEEHVNHTTPASLGFTYAPSLDLSVGPPFIQVAGYSSIGDPITGPRNTYDSDLDFSGSLTWVRGRHELKFGGGYNYDRLNVLQGIASNGFFVFAPVPFSDSFASFLFGQPVFFLQGGGDFSRNLRGNAVNFYAQDTYKLSSRLTINYGVRYEIPFPYTEQKNRQNLFEPGVQSTVFPTAPTGLLYPGDQRNADRSIWCP